MAVFTFGVRCSSDDYVYARDTMFDYFVSTRVPFRLYLRDYI